MTRDAEAGQAMDGGSNGEEMQGHCYLHHDGCDPRRWNAKESFQNLENRPWEDVLKFYSHLAAGTLSLSDLTFLGESKVCKERIVQKPASFGSVCSQKELRGGKWKRKTYKIILAYDGSAFIGWQKQPGLLTVQGVIEEALGALIDGKRADSAGTESSPVDTVLSVAGRTDKGVHAIGQVCSFYTWRTDINTEEITTLVNKIAPGALRAVSVDEVPRSFHPNFSAQWRRYVYILPLQDGEFADALAHQHRPASFYGGITDLRENNGVYTKDLNSQHKPLAFSVVAVNDLLSHLEGQQLSYSVFARDTKIARSRGPPTECTIYHARAATAELPVLDNISKVRTKVMCVELVANRFLRKMVRVLVATSIREAAARAPTDSLLRIMSMMCRRATAPPAPACGLCLAEASYSDISTVSLLIN